VEVFLCKHIYSLEILSLLPLYSPYPKDIFCSVQLFRKCGIILESEDEKQET